MVVIEVMVKALYRVERNLGLVDLHVIKEEYAWCIVRNDKIKKAARADDVPVGMCKILGCLGLSWLMKFLNNKLAEENVQDAWINSCSAIIFKLKRNVQEY